jgi:hypothetical protein
MHLTISTIKQIRASGYPYANHPAGSPNPTLGSEMALALREDQTPEEAMDSTYEKFQQVIDDSIFGE